MKTKTTLAAMSVLAVLALAIWLLQRPSPPQTIATAPPPAAAPTTEQKPEPGAEKMPAAAGIAQTSPAPEKAPDIIPAKKSASKKKSATPKELLHDPDAREALSLVGTDPEAEAYWLSAISDPSLPDKEREDLMEDLNEAGFADPKHPSADEIPLIQNRIALLEQIMPGADPFMQEHLGEAYKDLNNMLAGNPVP